MFGFKKKKKQKYSGGYGFYYTYKNPEALRYGYMKGDGRFGNSQRSDMIMSEGYDGTPIETTQTVQYHGFDLDCNGNPTYYFEQFQFSWFPMSEEYVARALKEGVLVPQGNATRDISKLRELPYKIN